MPLDDRQASFNLDGEDIIHLKKFVDDVHKMMVKNGILSEEGLPRWKKRKNKKRRK